jgi:hypothetical protein
MDRIVFHPRRHARSRWNCCSTRRGALFALLLLAVLVLSIRQGRARAEELTQRQLEAEMAKAKRAELERQARGAPAEPVRDDGAHADDGRDLRHADVGPAAAVNERLDSNRAAGGPGAAGDQHQDDGVAQQAGRAAGGDRPGADQHHPAVAGYGVAAIDPRQQADARTVRPGADGGDHRRPAGAGELPVPVWAFERQPAGLRDLHAQQPAAAGDRRQVPARKLAAHHGGGGAGGAAAGSGGVQARHGCAYRCHRRQVPDRRARRRTRHSCSCRRNRSSPISTRSSTTWCSGRPRRAS